MNGTDPDDDSPTEDEDWLTQLKELSQDLIGHIIGGVILLIVAVIFAFVFRGCVGS
jgi:hypothetical protein